MSNAKGKTRTKTGTKGEAKPKSTAKQTATEGDLGHRPGRRKGTIHELFDREGTEVAWVRGIKMGLKEGTLRSWFAHWRRLQGKTAKTTTPKKKTTGPKKTAAVSAPVPTQEPIAASAVTA
jgi:hypothetical protein